MQDSKSVISVSLDAEPSVTESSRTMPPSLLSHDESGHHSIEYIDKEKTLDNETSGGISPTESSEASVDDYPHGLKLILIAGAVMLSVFLMSVDQVRSALSHGGGLY